MTLAEMFRGKASASIEVPSPSKIIKWKYFFWKSWENVNNPFGGKLRFSCTDKQMRSLFTAQIYMLAPDDVMTSLINKSPH